MASTQEDLDTIKEKVNIYRVLVLGRCGAGKSWMAEQIAARISSPVIHLDNAFWQPGWTLPDKRVWECWMAATVAGEKWVMDGNYLSSLAIRAQRADIIIFLEISIWMSLFRYLRRVFVARRMPGVEVPNGCADIISWRMLKSVLLFSTREKPRILEIVRPHARFICLRSSVDIENFLRSQRPCEN